MLGFSRSHIAAPFKKARSVCDEPNTQHLIPSTYLSHTLRTVDLSRGHLFDVVDRAASPRGVLIERSCPRCGASLMMDSRSDPSLKKIVSHFLAEARMCWSLQVGSE